jgi:outer membrane receptor for ferrienterochelin and colicins
MENYIRKFIPTLLLLLNACCFILGQSATGSITGEIYDFETKDVLPSAQILIPKLNIATLTNDDGQFELKGITEGRYTVVIKYVGYTSLSREIEIKAGVNPPIRFGLEPSAALSLDEMVVSGTLKEVSRTESPVSVEVYTPKFFFKNPTSNIFDALQNVNGVRPQLQCNICNTGDIHINGMEGPYTMVMIDGLPIVSGLSTVYGLMGIPNSIIERVEIVKGPASTLYGSEAVGGLINVITKNPSKAATFSLDLNATSYNEFNADIATRLKAKKAKGLLSLNYFNFDKIWDINKDNITDMTLQKRFSIFNKWNFDRPTGRAADISLRYFTENRWGGQLNWTPEFYGTDSIYGENIKTNRFELLGNYQLPFKDKVMFNYSYNYHDQKSAYGTKVYNANQQIAIGQLTWNKEAGKHDLLMGAAFRYTFYDDNTPITADKTDLKLNKPWNIMLPGVFLQDQIKVNEKSTVLLGVRYDNNSEHGHILTPRINYKWAVNSTNSLRLSVGSGYRVVNIFSEDHAALTGAREVVIAEDLKPERSWNGNLNYLTQIFPTSGGFIDLDVTAFYTYFNNKILPDFFKDPKKIYFSNLDGYGTSYGVTVNTNWHFEKGLTLRAGVTGMDVSSVIKDKKTPQLYAAPFSGTWALSYTFNKQGITLDYTGNVTSPMHLPIVPNDYRPAKSPWFSIQNVQLTKKFKSGLEVYGGVKNLFNFIPEDPILRAFDPFNKTANDPINNPKNYTFDPSYNYAAIQKIRGFVGMRYSIK